MIHVFVLTVLLNGELQSQDMQFRSIHICQKYAYAIKHGKERTMRYQGKGSSVTTYCVPKLIDPETTNLPIYDH
jgi:hypothetical protein